MAIYILHLWEQTSWRLPLALYPPFLPHLKLQALLISSLSRAIKTNHSTFFSPSNMSLSLHFPNSTSSPFLKKHSFSLLITSTATTTRTIFPFKTLAYLKPLQSNPYKASPKPSILSDSLRVLEWDKVCDSVASFAGTSLGREATKVSSTLCSYLI